MIPTDLPDDCELMSARLRLYAEGDPGRTLDAARITEAWQEGQVTWLNQPTTDVTPTTRSGNGYREWIVTDDVQRDHPR